MPTTVTNDITMAYDIYGEGTPLLLIHGGVISSTEWQPQIEEFAKHYQVITWDLRGHGETSYTNVPYSVALFASDLVVLLDTLGIEQVICCGHSLGGMVAQELAIRYPDRIRCLILAETSYGTSSTWWEALQTVMARWTFRLMSVKDMARLSAQQTGKWNPEVGPYLEREMIRHANNKTNYLNIWEAVLTFDSRTRIQHITCPTLILIGEHYRQTHTQAHKMQQRIPNAKLIVVPNAGHMINWDNTAFFNQVVLAFCKQCD